MRKDCKVYDIDKRLGNGKLVQVPKGNSFNFEYILFIPENVQRETTLIIEGSNTGEGAKGTLEEAYKVMLKNGLHPDLPIYKIANDLGLPVLYPLFPRVHNGEEPIYNHMLSSNSLDSNTKKIKELGLVRVDLQLIEMFKDAKERLKEDNIFIDDKFIIDGFSASSKFANRFTLLHPELVKLCVGGAVSGVLTLPLKELDGEKLLYPVGLGDFDTDVEEFKKVRQFYYMGSEDINNDPFEMTEDGEPRNHGIIKKDELVQMNKIFGKHLINERWEKSKELYNQLGVNAVFKTYQGEGHRPHPAKEDLEEEIKNILNLEKGKTL